MFYGLRSLGYYFVAVFMAFLLSNIAYGSVYNNFDNMPSTEQSAIPGSGGNWTYSSPHTNPRSEIGNAGWYSTQPYPSNPKIFDYFSYYRNGYNTSHMGFETYGFLEIDSNTAVFGNSLKISVTGGKNNTGQYGTPLWNKEDYLSLIASKQDPVSSASKVGHPYIYFMNNSSSGSYIPFPQASGCNRLSLYVKLPSGMSNGAGGTGKAPQQIINIGPYNNMGGHWYHTYYNQGGGWTHILVDGHPQHNNAWSNATSYPYPSSSLRNMDTSYFNSMYRWYITFYPYDGIATPLYNVWLDEIEFSSDLEPQNDETIASPAVTYIEDTKIFEIGFNDKYKNNANSYSTYEIRYSFNQINNSNWDQAIPCNIAADSRFGISARKDGRFAKWWPYYPNVWAPFKLASSSDEAKLLPGARIYFAIKDISQTNGDGMTPVLNCGINSRWKICGRDYANYGSSFDYAGDQPVLKLIKGIDFVIPKSSASATGATVIYQQQ